MQGKAIQSLLQFCRECRISEERSSPVIELDLPSRIKVDGKGYNFRAVFPQAEENEDIFEELEPTVLSVLDGHDVCVLSHELVRQLIPACANWPLSGHEHLLGLVLCA
jgi:hypothetical protein